MSTVQARRKAMRGTKRTCQACEVRFYDLGRNPVVCPMCGAGYTPPADPPVAATARTAPFTNKTGWHRQPVKRLQPALPFVGVMPNDAIAANDKEIEEAATIDAKDSVVLEHQDDTDVAGLVDHADSDENEPRRRRTVD
jgi:uncharacterized protein (TIGR02300 family)